MSYDQDKIGLSPEHSPGGCEERLQEVLQRSLEEMREAIRRQFGMVGLRQADVFDFEDVLHFAISRAATVMDSEFSTVRFQDQQRASQNMVSAALAASGAPRELVESFAGPINVGKTG